MMVAGGVVARVDVGYGSCPLNPGYLVDCIIPFGVYCKKSPIADER